MLGENIIEINLGLFLCVVSIIHYPAGGGVTPTLCFTRDSGCCSRSIMIPDRNGMCEKEIIQINKHIHVSNLPPPEALGAFL